MMSLVRSLFWFALVALMFPRGAGLGLELPDSIHVPAVHVPFAPQIDVSRLIAADPIEAYRRAVDARLAQVRVELAGERARRGTRGLLPVLPQPAKRD